MLASFLAGAIGSGVTNSLDVITVNKQTNPKLDIKELIKKERWNLFTKGLLARITYNSL